MMRLALLLPAGGCAATSADVGTIMPLSSTEFTRTEAHQDQLQGEQAVAALNQDEGSKAAGREDEIFEGSGRFWKSPADGQQPRGSAEAPLVRIHDDKVTLNLVDVSVAEAAKSILADVLGANYVIDERVKARITLQTSKPVPSTALLEIFETVLSANGTAIVGLANGTYSIVPADSPGSSQLPVRVRGESSARQKIGRSVQVVPLRFVSAVDMQRILEPIAAEGAVLRTDPARNLVFLTGTGAELSTLLDTIDTFDVDWLAGMSFALVPIKASDPTAITKELESIFASGQSGPLEGLVRFVPNRRLSSVLVISPQHEYLIKASDWIKRLDKAAQATKRQLFVYNVQNREASELASLLRSVFAGQMEVEDARSVAPRHEPVQLASADKKPELAKAEEAPAEPEAAVGANEGVQIIGDNSNNSLLIVATHEEYSQITDMIETLDAIPNQVLLEATIAEVSLKDELKFGLKWFLESGKSSFAFTDAVSGLAAGAFPGFSYLFSSADVRVVLDALASITDVEVISSPSLMVLDNREAVLQVGDEVPVVIQSAVSVVDPGAPVVNTVAFRETGVILRVTPRVSDGGRVILDIEQEVSDVVETTTSGIDSPTIQQRRIRTTVVVNNGESLALGGLIQQSEGRVRDKVPLLGDIPLVGMAFRSTTDRVRRTELIILITPRVVRDLQEARRVTDEFRRNLNEVETEFRRSPRIPSETIRKLVN